MKAQGQFKKIGAAIIGAGIVLGAVFPIFYQSILRWVIRYFSPDQQITPHGVQQLASMYYFGVALLIVIGLGVYKAQNEVFRAQLKQLLLGASSNCQAPLKPSPRLILLSSTAIGLLLIASMRLSPHSPSVFHILYAKDHGLLDLSVPVAMVLSAALLGLALWSLWKDPDSAQGRTRVFLTVVYLGLIALALFDAGEETSWGQDFLRWQTPEVFAGNLESQTNLHNYLNPYFNYGYASLSLVMIIVLISIWMEGSPRWMCLKRLFMPHPSLIGLSLLIAFVAIVWHEEQELLEEMVAIFILFYGIQVYTLYRTRPLPI